VRSELSLEDAIDITIARTRTADDEVHHFLAGELADLFSRAGRDDEALEVPGEMMKRYPDDVRPAISKATKYLYFLSKPEEALKCIDVALKRAHRTLFFRREALGVKARILLKLGRGEQLSDVLEEIMSLQIKKEIPDIGRERDFVDQRRQDSFEATF
jgi:tetratricopeptide (TPR) repeat protein